ncbi:MAG: aminoacyl-tRNA hydrolase [Candidatus Binataceae bacterium]
MSSLTRLFDRFRTARGASKRTSDAVHWVIAGLGNPDEQYLRSRHNLGFMVVAELARRGGATLSKRRFKGLTAIVKIANGSVLLVQPQTYYNLSGECVASVLGYFDCVPRQLVVVHDELDLEFGRLQIKQGGGDAGNRGVRSIAEPLQSSDFIRLRIGIGRPPGSEDDKDFLLKPMTGDDRRQFAPVIERAADAVSTLIADDLSTAMNHFNQWP